MADTPALSLAFLARNPESAGAVLNDLPPSDASAFFAGVPPRLIGPVLARMAPWPAARCLAELAPDLAAAALREAPFQDAAAILRLLDETARGPVVEGFPRRLAADFRRSLDYPEGTVGAWVDPGVPVLAPDAMVGDARKAARKARTLIDVLFLVDDKRRLAGVVRTSALLRLDDTAALATAADQPPLPLLARMRIASALEVADWEDYSALPVVTRRDQVIGAVTRAVLGEAARKGAAAVSGQAAGADLSSHLFASYGATILEVLSLTAPARPLAQDKARRKVRATKTPGKVTP